MVLSIHEVVLFTWSTGPARVACLPYKVVMILRRFPMEGGASNLEKERKHTVDKENEG